MEINTMFRLYYGDDNEFVSEGDSIKLSLTNGEVLIGEYLYSDNASLTIERYCEDIGIDFEDVDDIKKLD